MPEETPETQEAYDSQDLSRREPPRNARLIARLINDYWEKDQWPCDRVYGRNTSPWWEWSWSDEIKACVYQDADTRSVYVVCPWPAPGSCRTYPDLDTAKVALTLKNS